MKYRYLTSIVTVVIVLFICTMSIITPDKDISDLEGRQLQQLPTPNRIINEYFNRNAYIYELLTGDMFKKWDAYFSDHFFSRDKVVNLFTYIQSSLDKKYINGAFLGESDYIFSLKNEEINIDESQLIKNVNYFEEFAKRFNNSKTYLVNLPRKEMVYANKFPIRNYKSPISSSIDTIINNINNEIISVLDFGSIINDEEDLFYKTDHHWNMNGTHKAYNYIINNIKADFKEVLKAKSKDEFDIKTYKNYFIGTHGRKVGQLVNSAEDIDIYYSDDFKNYKVYNQDGESKLIYEEFLDKEKFNNDYGVYLGGDNAEVKIENTKSNNNLKVVMIGDSMDNPLVPLMANHFKELYSYDLRHYQNNIIKTIDEINPDIILLIGLSDNFISGENSEIFKWSIE